MVYVDNYMAKFNGMLMSHLIADSHEELVEFAEEIGLKIEWIQKPGTFEEHFDISKTKRLKAIKHGAQPIPIIELGKIINNKRKDLINNYKEKE